MGGLRFIVCISGRRLWSIGFRVRLRALGFRVEG